MPVKKQTSPLAYRNEVKPDSIESVKETASNTKRKYFFPQKDRLNKMYVHTVKDLDETLKNFKYSGKPWKFNLGGTIEKYEVVGNYKKILLRDIKVFTLNNAKVTNFYNARSNIQLHMCQFISKWFNLPETVKNVVCYMKNFEKEDVKLCLIIWDDKFKIITDDESGDYVGKTVNVDIKASRIAIFRKNEEPETCIAVVNWEICSDLHTMEEYDIEKEIICEEELTDLQPTQV